MPARTGRGDTRTKVQSREMTVADNCGRVHGPLGRWKIEREGSGRNAGESEKREESLAEADEATEGIEMLKCRERRPRPYCA